VKRSCDVEVTLRAIQWRDTSAVRSDSGGFLLSELIGAMSYALDLTEGEPAGHATRSCLIGMRLAEELDLDADTRSDLFYALLLKDAGCSANSAKMAALFGADDQQAKRTSKTVDWAQPFPALVWALKTVAPRGSPAARWRRLMAIKEAGEVTRTLMAARCERGAAVARMLGLSDVTADAIYALDEHWDGGGHPHGRRGEEIPLLGRILCLAQTLEIFHRTRGIEAAYEMARERRGRWFDPDLVDALQRFHERAFWDTLAHPDLSAAEPPDRRLTADEDRLDRVADAFAAVVDAKSPWTYRHSDRTSVIAISIGAALDADAAAQRDLGRAARLHDIGKLAISNRILDKPAALTGRELRLMREHPVITHRVLERVPGLSSIATLAGAHHERLDGSGYPDGLKAPQLTPSMRVLAVADVYEALTSARPYRPALTSDEALQLVRGEAPRRLDADVVLALEKLLAGDAPDLARPSAGPLRR
jgi:HD-GYP domain-containing protein (c-di-GMP phosphodiesterase class II)